MKQTIRFLAPWIVIVELLDSSLFNVVRLWQTRRSRIHADRTGSPWLPGVGKPHQIGIQKKPNGFSNGKTRFTQLMVGFVYWSSSTTPFTNKFSASLSFSTNLLLFTTTGWSCASLLDPVLLQWPGHWQKIFKGWGSTQSPGVLHWWRKNCEQLLGKQYTRQADMLETITKILVLKSLTISSTIYPKAQPSTSSVCTCTCFHNGAGHRS